MDLCTKCGDEIDKSWKHCPACGQANIQNASLKLKSFEGTIQSFTPHRSSIKNNPALPIFVFLVGAILIFAISNIRSYVEDQQVQTYSDSLDKAKRTQFESSTKQQETGRDRTNFATSLSSFKSLGCKPKFYKNDSNRTANWDMELEGVSGIEDFGFKYAFNQSQQENWQTWGNQVDRALIVIASLELQISDLYWYIYDIYKTEGMAKYKSDFNQWFSVFNKMAINLCYQSEPTAEQYELAQKLMPEIDKFYGDFRIWRTEAMEEIEAIRGGMRNEVEEGNTAQCTEIKTNIPGYNIIKCKLP